MFALILLLLIVIPVVILIVCYLLQPTPPVSEDPQILKISFMIIRIISFFANFMTYFNGRGCAVNFRSIANAITSAGVLPNELTKTTHCFDGVEVKIYQRRQKSGQNLPAIFYIHGGGWILGAASTLQELYVALCEQLDVLIVSVEYRLAPEHKFPAAYEDCFTAACWFLKHYENFNVDASRITVMGDSAGGQLAASVVQGLEGVPGPKIKSQVLIYPVTQVLDLNTPSYQQNLGGFKNDMLMFFSNYIVGRDDAEFVKEVGENNHIPSDNLYLKRANHDLLGDESKYPPYSRPLRGRSVNMDIFRRYKDALLDFRMNPLCGDLSELPPALIMTYGLDVLRDDGILYAENLKMAGVKVKHCHYKGGHHGIMGYPKMSNTGRKSLKDLILFLKDNL